MGKLIAGGGALGSVLAGAVAWFVLYVIIGVTLWVSFVVWGGVAIVGLLLVTPLLAKRQHGDDSSRRHPGSPIGAR